MGCLMRSTVMFRHANSCSGSFCGIQPNHRLILSLKKRKALPRVAIMMNRFSFLRQTKAANFSSHSKGSKPNRALSRTERRLLERKERNRNKREARISNSDKANSNLNFAENTRKFFRGEVGLYSILNNSPRLERLFELLFPRLPGRNVSFTHYSLWMALGLRLPLFMAISYLLTDENTSPYIIQCSLGPSMLPTIQFAGDIWLIETGAWGRALRRLIGDQNEENVSDLSNMYEVGDLVIWENPDNGKRSCKRIIGLEGDTIDKRGEYNKFYRYRPDSGVVLPRGKDGTMGQSFGAYSMTDTEDDKYDSINSRDDQVGTAEESNTLVVPRQCVWLEGDCPLFSMDSRQYGPINVSNLRGRLVFRLWPWSRSDLINDEQNSYLSSCRISRNRPVPYSSIEPYIGKRFNFYRVASGTAEN
mmetsp:Transcript_13532/g.31658  ORF Transcript_13532/g.31658 Transcript_13532/m.31658 type:complete len:418 (+) Transcript_13532:229-1482(+)